METLGSWWPGLAPALVGGQNQTPADEAAPEPTASSKHLLIVLISVDLIKATRFSPGLNLIGLLREL